MTTRTNLSLLHVSIALVPVLAAGCLAAPEAASVAEDLDGTSILVNECSAGTSGFIELLNPTTVAIDLAADGATCWYVDDVAGGGAPKRITDAVVNHVAGSTTCASAGRPATCGIVGAGERVWVPYSYVNATTADACRFVRAPLSAGVCGTQVDVGVGGATGATVAGQCFGRSPDGSAWSGAAIACTPSGASNGCAVGVACNDGNACTTGDTIAADCSCRGGAPVSCDDANGCTTDSCAPASGCAHAPVVCDDADACTIDACDSAVGACTHASASCDDANACTADLCDALGGCGHAPVTDGTGCGAGSTCVAGACTSGDTSITDGAEDRILLRGTILGPDGPFAGEILVDGDTIACVAPSCSTEPGAAGATVIETHGIVMPGLVDAHNHGLFNVFDETDWSPSRVYTNHNQWTSDPRYGDLVDAKQYLAGEAANAPVDVRCEMNKWAELRALVAGTTSMLIAPGTTRACYGSLIRSVDVPQNDLGFDRVQTSISVPTDSGARSICNNFASGATDAYVVHVAEGVDATALREFATLGSRAGGCLLAPQTTIVHGTALGAPEFAVMAARGMSLVWSPRSNDFLYDGTTHIELAIAAGVETIALAPDWAIGGSANLLDELRYARSVDQTRLGGLIGDERLVRMVTIDAARALGLEDHIGSLEVGKRADILVIAGDAADPYGALFEATPARVRLVLVDGRALYGDTELFAVGPVSPGCEHQTIDGREKFICVAEANTTNLLNQTFDEIHDTLVSAFAAYDAEFMTPETAFSPITSLVP